MDKKIATGYKLRGDMILVAFSALKDVLPAITRYKLKTKNNEIVLGKWQKK